MMFVIIGVILIIMGFAIAFLAENEVLDVPFLLHELSPYIALFCALIGLCIVSFSAIQCIPEEVVQSAEYSTDNQPKQSHCSLLADSCIVEHWTPICLIKQCIIDARK